MATIGLSRPYYAKYNNNDGIVTYSDGGSMGKFTELSISLNEGSSNILYADNAPAESDNQFSGGTASITTDDLRAELMAPVFGAKEEAINAEGLSTTGAKWYVFDDDQVIPDLGIGGIIKKKVGGAIKWVAFILVKTQFTTPGIVATTQGETITWQTQSLTAKLMRGDDEKHRWHMISSPLDSEEDAEAIVKAYLNIK